MSIFFCPTQFCFGVALLAESFVIFLGPFVIEFGDSDSYEESK